MAALSRRLHVLIDDERLARLASVAEQRGTTMSEAVRDALDLAYPPGGLSPDIATARFLDRPPRNLGTWAQAKESIESSLTRGEHW